LHCLNIIFNFEHFVVDILSNISPHFSYVDAVSIVQYWAYVGVIEKVDSQFKAATT